MSSGRKRRACGFALVAMMLGACGGGDAGPPEAEGSVPPNCTPVRSPKILGAQHIEDGKSATYNSTPPTSGQHYQRPVAVGAYTTPVQDERQVHNLEHGHVMIQYRDLESAQVDALEDVVAADRRMVLLAPYPDMDPKLALTSWGKIQTCDSWSDDLPALAQRFIDRHRDNAPESIA